MQHNGFGYACKNFAKMAVSCKNGAKVMLLCQIDTTLHLHLYASSIGRGDG